MGFPVEFALKDTNSVVDGPDEVCGEATIRIPGQEEEAEVVEWEVGIPQPILDEELSWALRVAHDGAARVCRMWVEEICETLDSRSRESAPVCGASHLVKWGEPKTSGTITAEAVKAAQAITGALLYVNITSVLHV